MEYIKNTSHGIIKPKTGKNTRIPYDHQKEAMLALSNLDESKESYSGLIVLPTGGGKTYTAATWLLKNALDNEKKVLWIAHRHFLLDQAADAFQSFAYAEQMPHISSFAYRIISGSSRHDRTSDIKPSDKIIIASKDSIGRNFQRLDKWLKNEEELYFVIDEAHHATAKTYRKLIEHLEEKIPVVKIIGLTATPYRTAESEKGLLKKVFPDDIIYSVSLKELINRQILSRLEVEEYQTGEDFGKNMGKNAWESIVHMDTIPDDIVQKIAENRERNHLIVDTYKKNQEKYGQTIVFTVSIAHAIALAALFKKEKIKADYVVSATRDMGTGVTISQQQNEKKIDAYRRGDIQVLINVEILTEGVDLPQTQTVFLARPTVSRTLLTQMVGRALRGVKAGGTEIAYAVSFIDNWDIPFVYPESLLADEDAQFVENETNRTEHEVRLMSISKIEEFARMLDETVDTSALESIPFIQRIPIGMYSFTYLDESGMDISYQVMVYNSNKAAYQKFLNQLQDLFEKYGSEDEYLSKTLLSIMEKECRNKFFAKTIFPAYDAEDVKHILQYYALKEAVPIFYSFEDIDKNRLDVSLVAKEVYDKDMGPRAQAAYLDQIWKDRDDNILRLFFGRKLYFLKQVEVEIGKMMHPEEYQLENNVQYGKKAIDDLSLSDMEAVNPARAKKLRDATFLKAKDTEGYYRCALCGKRGKTRRGFQVDHIVPMNNGGKSVLSNLQILCSKCNGIKGDD